MNILAQLIRARTNWIWHTVEWEADWSGHTWAIHHLYYSVWMLDRAEGLSGHVSTPAELVGDSYTV